jgi:hypothetical protein
LYRASKRAYGDGARLGGANDEPPEKDEPAALSRSNGVAAAAASALDGP